jgi:CRISPR-associated protein Csm4
VRRLIVEPALAGEPPFVLSDAFPGDLLPLPIVLRLHDWPGDRRKAVKRARYLRPAHFEQARAGEVPPVDALLGDPLVEHARQHNTLSRLTDTTGEEGSLFTRPDLMLPGPEAGGLDGADYLSVYFRAADAAAADLLISLLEELADTGFGADAATGRGQFELVGGPEPAGWLDEPPQGANGVTTLSTFQPTTDDPMAGLWEAFTKFGKLGPGFGLGEVRKNPLVLLRPGACFLTPAPRPVLGRAVPMEQLLPVPATEELRRRAVEVIHPAFGLAVPARLHTGVWS